MANPLKGQVAIITGASRGIGRECALALAKHGVNIVVAAKSAQPQPTLPGTIYSVANEVEDLGTGAKALALQVDVRDDRSVEDMVKRTIEKFGRIDILINNAGALWWKDMVDTPMKRYDLINGINVRGTFACTKACLPVMKKQGYGHIINMSPPLDFDMLPGKIAYCISKFGMTLIAHGIGKEMKGSGIACNALWPATMVESWATINFKMGDSSLWRKASIIADSVVSIVQEDPKQFTGYALIDEDYLRSKGINDFTQYRCDPNVEPPRITGADSIAGVKWERGLVNEVQEANFPKVQSKI